MQYPAKCGSGQIAASAAKEEQPQRATTCHTVNLIYTIISFKSTWLKNKFAAQGSKVGVFS